MIFLSIWNCGFSKTVDIFVKGVDDATQKNIQKRIDLLSQHKRRDTDLPYLRRALPKEVKKAMEPYGYFEPQVRLHERIYREQVILTVQIKPGRAVTISKLHIAVTGDGSHHPEFKAVIRSSKLIVGQRLITPEYNRSKMAFFHIAEKLGYLKAKLLEHQIKLDLKEHTAEIDLVFDTGKRYYFGPITFEQNILDEGLLRRYLKFKRGEPFSIKALLTLQDALRGSNYFSSVNVKWDENDAVKYHVPIKIILKPGERRLYNFGIGYGTDTSVRGTFGFENRLINRRGDHFQTRIQASPKQSSLQARYIIPGKYPPTDEYQFFTTAVRYRLRQNDSLSTVFGASYLSHWREWTRTLNINYLIEWRRDRPGTSALTSRWLYPSVNFRKIHAKDHINTDNGYRINLTFQGAYDGVFAHDSFFKGLIETKYIRSFNHFRFITRQAIGGIMIDNIDNLAAHFQFYAGGSQSVRGYQFQSIGPGKYLITGSVELQHKLFDKWRIASFFDMGSVSNSLKPHFRRGVGIGLVRATPIGSVEIGVARPLDSSRKGVSLVFSLGPDLA